MANIDSIGKKAVVFIAQTQLRQNLRHVLTELGIIDITFPSSSDKCGVALQTSSQPMFITGSGYPLSSLTKLLRLAQGDYGLDTRPIYFIGEAPNNDILPILGDYNISRISLGPIEPAEIKKQIEYILDEHSKINQIKSKLNKALKASDDNIREAEKQLRELSNSHPNHVRIKVELASVLQSLGKWKEAEKLIEPIARKDPNHPRALHLLSRCFLKKKKFQEASNYLEKASLLNPFDCNDWNALTLNAIGFLPPNQGSVNEKLYDFLTKNRR